LNWSNKPEIYLDENVRNGISSFASQSNKEEVISGIRMLEEDIKSKKIEKVIQSFETELGDYLFINARKY
jgi:hypothetical protein